MIKRHFQTILNHVGEGDTFLRGFSWKVFQRKIEHSECYKKMEKIKNMGYIKIYTVCF